MFPFFDCKHLAGKTRFGTAIKCVALTDRADIITLTDHLGDMEVAIQSLLDVELNNSAAKELVAARDEVVGLSDGVVGAPIDSLLTLCTTLRNAEKTLNSSTLNSVATVPQGLSSYFLTEHSVTFKNYWDGSTTNKTPQWSPDFRSLWRRVMNEELIIKLAGGVRVSGAWVYTYDPDGIVLPSTLKLKTSATIGGADLTVTVNLTQSNGDPAIATIVVPSGSVLGRTFDIASAGVTTFIGVTSISVTGSTTNGDAVSVWVV